MRRREFLSVLSSAVSWPIVVRAQTPKLRTIGFLGTDATNWAAWTAAFVARMRELGWIEGSTIAIEYRWSEGRMNALSRWQLSLFAERSISSSRMDRQFPH